MKLKSLLKDILNEKSFSKLREDSGLGANFNKVQQAHDSQMPPEDEPEIKCPECGESTGHITKNYKQGKYYSWEAKCDVCGHTWNDDNFDDSKDDYIAENK